MSTSAANHREDAGKLLELMNEFGKVTGYKINTKKINCMRM